MGGNRSACGKPTQTRGFFLIQTWSFLLWGSSKSYPHSSLEMFFFCCSCSVLPCFRNKTKKTQLSLWETMFLFSFTWKEHLNSALIYLSVINCWVSQGSYFYHFCQYTTVTVTQSYKPFSHVSTKVLNQEQQQQQKNPGLVDSRQQSRKIDVTELCW